MGELVHPDFGSARRVKLAHEASFAVGRITAHPSTRQISCGPQRKTLEPRVMQVLVALARAKGEVVSKDELLDLCWDGRVVGEDAINRVVSRLRHVAATFGSGSFRVETIRGVGYRLVDCRPVPDQAQIGGDGKDALVAISRRTTILGSAAAVVLAAGGIWVSRPPKHKPSPQALEYYRRGLATRGQNSLEISERGAALFREATRIDPQFADAWGALAWNYRALLEYGPRPDSARLHALSRSAAARALELDSDNADAKAALLLLKPFFRNWAEIENGCRRLLRENPGHEIAEYNVGRTLINVGRWRESVRYFRAVSERQPFWPLPHSDLTRALYCSGREQEAEDEVEEGIKRFPRHSDYWFMKVRNLAISGRLEEALAFANDVSKRPAEGPLVQPEIEFEISLVNALADGSASARNAVLDQASENARRFPGYMVLAVMIASLLGRLDVSFSILDGYFFGEGPWAFGRFERSQTGVLFIRSTALLRRDARFPQLLQRTNLEDYWRSTGTVPDYRRFPEPEYRLPIG